MTVIVVAVLFGLVLVGVVIEHVNRAADTQARRQHRDESHDQLMRELRRH